MRTASPGSGRAGGRAGQPSSRGTAPGAGEHPLFTGPLSWSVHVEPTDTAVPDGSGLRRIDDIWLIDWRAGPFDASRTARHVAENGHDHLVVDVVDAGGLFVRQSGSGSPVGAGGAIAWDAGLPVRVRAPEQAAGRRLVVPRGVLDDVGCHLSPLRPVGVLAATTVLRGYLDTLRAAPETLSGPPAIAARNALLELIWGALQPELPLDPHALLPARRAAVDRFIDSHLGRPGLSVEDVAAAHGISARTLGRLFSATNDTFGRVLAAKRLARVREELLTRDATVESLARRWGFTDSSHLNRRFRSTFGASPASYRDAYRLPPSAWAEDPDEPMPQREADRHSGAGRTSRR